MGREISRIKSITSDIWTDREVEAMREMGNRKANAMYLATFKPNSRAPSNDTEVYRLIKEKYREKLYMRDKDKKGLEERGRSSASKHTSANNRSVSTSSNTANTDVNIEADDHVTFAGQLKVLVSMGFTDTTKNLKALKRAKGGIDASVEILLSNPSSSETRAPVEKNQRQASATKTSVSSKQELSKTLESALQFLEGMGFSDQADNLAALKKAGGNVDQAVTILMNAPPKSTSVAAVAPAQKPSAGGIGMDLLSLEDAPAQRPTPVAQASDSPFGGFFGQPPVQQQQNAFNSMSANNMQPFNPQAQFQQQQRMLPFQQSQPSQSQLQQAQLQFQQAQLQQNQLQQLQLQQLQQAQSQNPMQQQQQQPNQQNIQSQMWAALSQPQQQPSQSPQPQPATMQPYSPFSSNTAAGPNYNPHITPNSGSIFLQKGNPPVNNNNSNSGAPDPFSSLVKDSMRLQNSNSNAFGSNGAPMSQGMGQFQQQQQPLQQQQQQPGYSMYSATSQPAPFGGFTQSQVPRTMMDSPFNSQGMSTPGMQGMNMQQQQQQFQQQMNQQQLHQQQQQTNPFI
ncbi:SPARC- modular calcium-binding protein 2 [Chytriomyces hyalinus]|nr:SPARC- modular calcium-binding protein 2 [Chytriomyces hyalinus]